jgi:error-prone DNA polymerase
MWSTLSRNGSLIFLPSWTTVGSRDAAFPLSHGRGDQVTHAGGGPDPREQPPKGFRTRDIYVADLHIDVLKTKSRNFH